MKHSAFLSATLGLPTSWHVIEARLSDEIKRIDLKVSIVPGSLFKCPRCGCDAHTTDRSEELWFHDSFFNLQAYLTAQVPRITCPQGCGLQRVSTPWERPGSMFRRISDRTTSAE